jgi:transcriptional regulator with XRE-family HTH domain
VKLGVLQSRISNYRSGRAYPDIHMARLIATILNKWSGEVISDIRKEKALRSVADRRKTAFARACPPGENAQSVRPATAMMNVEIAVKVPVTGN